MLKNEAWATRPVCLPRRAVDPSVLGLADLGLLAYILAQPEDTEMTEGSLAEGLGIGESELRLMLERIAARGFIGAGSELPPTRPVPTRAAPPLPAGLDPRSRRGWLKTASPPWLSPAQLAQMASIRRDARRASRETGVPHEVDHIVPLRGVSVCGLNVPWNLRVVNGRVNNLKSNRLDEDLCRARSAAHEAQHQREAAHA